MSGRRRAAWAAVLAGLAAGGAVAVAVAGGTERDRPAPRRGSGSSAGAFVVRFSGPDRLVASERSGGGGPLEVTSGSLFVRDGHGWSGPPDLRAPDPSRGTTHSGVFRARTRRDDFGDARVRLRLRNEGLAPAGRRAHDYDGVSIGVRYRSPDELYYVSVQRRDGQVAIKKKVPDRGGRYVTLATAAHPPAIGQWVTVDVTTESAAGAVRLSLVIDGREVVAAADDGSHGGRPLTRPGRVLVRGDNCQFSFDDLAVTPLPA